MLPTDDIFLLHSPLLPTAVSVDDAPIIRLSIAHPAVVTSFKRIQSAPDIGGIHIEFTTIIQSNTRTELNHQQQGIIDGLLQSNPAFEYSSASDQQLTNSAVSTTVKGFVNNRRDILLVQRILRLKSLHQPTAFRFIDNRIVHNAAKENFFKQQNSRDGVGVEFGMDLFKNQRDFSFMDTINLHYLGSSYATTNSHRVSLVDQETHGDLIFTYRETKCATELALIMERKLVAQYAAHGPSLLGTDWKCHGFMANSSRFPGPDPEQWSSSSAGHSHQADHHQRSRRHGRSGRQRTTSDMQPSHSGQQQWGSNHGTSSRSWHDDHRTGARSSSADQGRRSRDRDEEDNDAHWQRLGARFHPTVEVVNGDKQTENGPKKQQQQREEAAEEPPRTSRSRSSSATRLAAVPTRKEGEQQQLMSPALSAIELDVTIDDNRPADWLVKVAQRAEMVYENRGVGSPLYTGNSSSSSQGLQPRQSRRVTTPPQGIIISSTIDRGSGGPKKVVGPAERRDQQQTDNGSSSSGNDADEESGPSD